ncbi:MAG: hypothetical protein QNJ12_19190, partial [Ilumatobacter sp.]|uniref:hypothetical protein n=1 Tax=Ilumatobacter sp. TaxID=1967498 RepID=UPI002623C13E
VGVGGSIGPWLAVGFAADDDGRIPFSNGALTFVEGGSGLLGLGVDGLADGSVDVEGIAVVGVDVVAPIDHPNGAFELDHLVIMTDSLERTSGAVEEALGLEQRRVREAGDVRQAFHRFPDRGCIVEIVERSDVTRVGLWGLVVNVVDLDAAVAGHGPDVIGAPKAAVQPGRRIATFRSGAGLGVPTALMST